MVSLENVGARWKNVFFRCGPKLFADNVGLTCKKFTTSVIFAEKWDIFLLREICIKEIVYFLPRNKPKRHRHETSIMCDVSCDILQILSIGICVHWEHQRRKTGLECSWRCFYKVLLNFSHFSRISAGFLLNCFEASLIFSKYFIKIL